MLRTQNAELSKKLAKSTRAYQVSLGQYSVATVSLTFTTTQGVKVQLTTAKREEQQSKDEMQKLQHQLLQACNCVHTYVAFKVSLVHFTKVKVYYKFRDGRY